MANSRICSIPECGKKVRRRGLCYLHLADVPKRKLIPSATAISLIEETVRGETDECVVWPYHRDSYGYGIVRDIAYNMTRAHRSVCCRTHGPPPFAGAHACHSCDNPPCINPRHLSWGSAKENIEQSFDRGRGKIGAATYNSKLSKEQVEEIRQSTESSRILGKRFGVSFRLVCYIRRGERRGRGA